MAAYVISEVTILDQELGDRYRVIAQESIEKYGGRYIVRGAQPEAAQGSWPAEARLVIAEFPSRDRLDKWYASPEYAEGLEIARTALRRRLLFADGVPR